MREKEGPFRVFYSCRYRFVSPTLLVIFSYIYIYLYSGAVANSCRCRRCLHCTCATYIYCTAQTFFSYTLSRYWIPYTIDSTVIRRVASFSFVRTRSIFYSEFVMKFVLWEFLPTKIKALHFCCMIDNPQFHKLSSLKFLY